MRGKMRGSKGVGLNYVAAAVGDCGDMMGFLLVLSVSVGIFSKKTIPTRQTVIIFHMPIM